MPRKENHHTEAFQCIEKCTYLGSSDASRTRAIFFLISGFKTLTSRLKEVVGSKIRNEIKRKAFQNDTLNKCDLHMKLVVKFTRPNSDSTNCWIDAIKFLVNYIIYETTYNGCSTNNAPVK